MKYIITLCFVLSAGAASALSQKDCMTALDNVVQVSKDRGENYSAQKKAELEKQSNVHKQLQVANVILSNRIDNASANVEICIDQLGLPEYERVQCNLDLMNLVYAAGRFGYLNHEDFTVKNLWFTSSLETIRIKTEMNETKTKIKNCLNTEKQ